MKPLKQLLIPTLSEVIIYSLLSVGILALTNVKSILDIPLLPQSASSSVGNIFHQYADSTFLRIDQVQAIGRLTNVLIWASVGAVTYIILWGISSLFVGVHNEMVVSMSYAEIGRNHKKSFWTSELSRGIFRACSLLLILLLTSFAVQVLVPASTQMVKIWINQPANVKNCLYAVIGFLDVAILMYLYAVLLRLFFMRSRVFS
jgi:hypothetical protein